MTSVLAGAYPDIFKAGIVDSGVAFGCFAVPGQPEDSWNSQCSQGQLILTGQQWVSSGCELVNVIFTFVPFYQAQKVKNAFPGFTGTYPKMQVWHGTA